MHSEYLVSNQIIHTYTYARSDVFNPVLCIPSSKFTSGLPSEYLYIGRIEMKVSVCNRIPAPRSYLRMSQGKKDERLLLMGQNFEVVVRK